jgi:hypothetical protein
MAVAAPLEFYKVELEVASKAGDGTMQYTFAPYGDNVGLSETEAQEKADEMKLIGVGGRIVHLDGTPEGKVTQTWGSVERAAAAEKIEKEALGK